MWTLQLDHLFVQSVLACCKLSLMGTSTGMGGWYSIILCPSRFFQEIIIISVVELLRRIELNQFQCPAFLRMK